MRTKEAALCLIQEINVFSDQPGYAVPKDLRLAINVIAHVFGITKEECNSYPPEEV